MSLSFVLKVLTEIDTHHNETPKAKSCPVSKWTKDQFWGLQSRATEFTLTQVVFHGIFYEIIYPAKP